MRLVLYALLLSCSPLLAQAPNNPYPDLLGDLQRNRTTVLAYIDAMPDSATGFRPTPGVRTFAEQFDHIVTTNLEVAAVALKGLKAAPVLGDSAKYLHDKAALRTYAASTYDICSMRSRRRPRPSSPSASRCTANPRSPRFAW